MLLNPYALAVLFFHITVWRKSWNIKGKIILLVDSMFCPGVLASEEASSLALFFSVPSKGVGLAKKTEEEPSTKATLGRGGCVSCKFKGSERVLHSRQNRLKTITTATKHEL